MENAFTVHRRDTYLNLAPAGEPRQLAPMDTIGSQILTPMVDEKRIQIAQEADRRKAETAAQAQRLRQEALAAKEAEQQEWIQSQRRSRGEESSTSGQNQD